MSTSRPNPSPSSDACVPETPQSEPHRSRSFGLRVFFLVLAVLLIVLDQWSKSWVIANIPYNAIKPVFGDFFSLTHLTNSGAAFSFLAGQNGWQKYLFSTIAAVAIVAFIVMILRRKTETLYAFGYSLMLAGACGNLIDRFYRGAVTDFLLFYWNGHYFPAFNLADSCITVGAVLIIGHQLFYSKMKQQAQAKR